jgi:SAM-dependent methyltransferase
MKITHKRSKGVHVHVSQRSILALLLLAILLYARASVPAAEGEYVPQVGQAGKDVVWVPNPTVMVDKLLSMAGVTATDYVIDLGSGDGRNVIAAAKRGARAHGIEYNPDLVEFSKRLAAKEGLGGRATFEKADLFTADFSKATVVILFLLPEMNLKLRPKLLDLKPGTRIVANTFSIGDWTADETTVVEGDCNSFCTARIWYVPAKVAGTWKLPQGELRFEQNHQTVSGNLKTAGGTAPVAGKLRGDQIAFSTSETQFTGRVAGNVIEGFARTAGKDVKFRAARAGN